MDEIKIREKLAKTIAEDPNNIDKILKLSHELASLDKNKVRFSVDSGVIDRLGKELVARHETAVSELVKNAYNVDASPAVPDLQSGTNSLGICNPVSSTYKNTNPGRP